MDLNKIGKFIAEKRKEKNLTQEQLGNLLLVDRRTISKWENGIYAPDISLLETLASSLDVSVNELLHGEKEFKNKKDIDNSNFIETIKYYNKNYNKKIQKYFVLILLVLFTFMIVYVGINKYFSYKIQHLSNVTGNYEVDGIIVHNNLKEIIFLNQIIYNDVNTGTDLEKKVSDLKISLYLNNALLNTQNLEYSEKTFLNDAINDIKFSYIEIETKEKKNNFYLLVEYTDEKGDIIIDKIILDIR